MGVDIDELSLYPKDLAVSFILIILIKYFIYVSNKYILLPYNS
jgi:hypothetical protein